MSGILSVGGAGNVGASGSFYSYSIDQSLRFNDGDSAYLSRTPASAGNQKTWTWSAWVKRANIGTNQTLFSGGTGSTLSVEIRLGSDNKFHVLDTNNTYLFSTTQLFRDVSWYHFVIECDTTQATVNDRTKLYVNGEQVTSFSTDNRSNFSQNEDTGINSANARYIARWINGGGYFDGYMAEVHFIDGQALDPTSFGETINGIWVPKAYSGSYGTNGFYLSFADSAAIGDDLSGNTNDFTATNLAASDVVTDSPTLNYPTMNPLNWNVMTFSEGNLKLSTTTNNRGVHSTFAVPKSGKFYLEMEVDAYASGGGAWFGFCSDNNLGDNEATITNGIHVNSYAGYVYVDNVVSTATGYTSKGANYSSSGDIYSLALDVDNEVFYVAKNGTWFNSADPAAGTGGLDVSSAFTSKGDNDFFVTLSRGGSYNETYIFNFGQDGTFAGGVTAGGNSDDNGYGDFKYSVPSGFLALNSANLPEPTIGPNSATTSDEHFNTLLYTGDNTASRAITGIGFQPDFIWLKARNTASYHHQLHDSVRGASAGALYSSLTNAEDTSYPITSFDSDGFTTKSGVQNGQNTSNTYVAWNWKAGGTAVSNTDGSITSSVSANPDAGFSIVSYTGTGANATVGHGLSSADLVIVKNRDATSSWLVRHSSLTASQTLLLENTTSVVSTNYWQSTHPDSSVFYVSSNSEVNGSGNNLIAYCFANVDGHLKCGSYVGNGSSTDGTFVYTGFAPSLVMAKSTGVENWIVLDNKRPGYNPTGNYLYWNLANAEGGAGGEYIDLLSNGFKLKTTGASANSSGVTYIYLAIGEFPLKYSRAR